MEDSEKYAFNALMRESSFTIRPETCNKNSCDSMLNLSYSFLNSTAQVKFTIEHTVDSSQT